MDTKLKNSRIIGSIIITVAIVLMAFGLVSTYDSFWEVSQKYKRQPYEESWFSNYIYQNLYGNYIDIAESRAGKSLNPFKVYFNVEKKTEEEQEDINWERGDYTIGLDDGGNLIATYNTYLGENSHIIFYSKGEFKDNLFSFYNDPNLKIRIIDNAKHGNETPDEWKLDDNLRKNHSFYVKIVVDKNGTIHVDEIFGADKQTLERQLRRIQGEYPNFIPYEFQNYQKDIKMVITDVTMYCAVPNELVWGGNIYYNTHYMDSYLFYEQSGFPFVALGALLLTMGLAFVLSSKKICGLGSGFVSKIWLEAIIAIDILIGALSVRMSEIIHLTKTGNFAETLLKIGITDKIIMPLHIGAWAAILGVGALNALSIKQIFEKGLGKYLVENVLIIKIIYHTFRKIKKACLKMAEIKLDDTVNKFLIRVLLLNFIVITFFCSIWFFGVLGLIVYTIVLFFLLKKKLGKLKDNYDSVVDITEQLANGNLNVTEERGLGIFEPIKINLSRIQEGFKKAVDKEIKSQHMKTELITNVSHDLKTPLTAIITYINLLKEEGITEEERKSYIETLDLKSQRLKQLIEDLFEVSKANSGNMEVNLESMDVLSLIRQVELELAEKLEEAGIELSIRSNKEKVFLELDGQKSYRILENLFGNLVKYAVPNRKAYVDVLVKEATTLIEVKNISKEELDFDNGEITERFVRGDKARNSEGTGLGLAIVKSLVELQGGRFEVVTDGDLFKAMITFVH